MRQKIHTSDLLWLLAYPLYQVIGTIRHEGSHALAGILEGAQVTEFVFLPRFGGRTLVVWGHVSFNGVTSWLTSAAPYFCDLITFILAFLLLYACVVKPHWLWINVVAIGLVGPIANSVWNYAKLFHPYGIYGDTNYLVDVLPPPLVHSYFLLTIIPYLWGTMLILKGSPSPALHPPSQGTHVTDATATKRHN